MYSSNCSCSADGGSTSSHLTFIRRNILKSSSNYGSIYIPAPFAAPVTIENNGSFGDNFTLNVDDTTPAAIVTGSINGAVGFELFLFLRALNGAPFIDTSLPPSLNLADFPDMRRIDLAFQSNRGAVIGEISTLSAVPLPAAIWLFISGSGGLGLLLWGRNKAEQSLNG